MNFATQLLSPYKDLIGQVCGIVTIGQMLSGVFLLNDIRKRGKTGPDDSIVPFLGGCVLSTIALRFGVALGDDALIRTNLMGLALSICFLTFFFWYTPNQQKSAVWRSIGIGGAIVAAIFAYAQYENEHVLASRLGMIMFGLVFCLSAMPFLSLPQIIRTKSVGPLPFPVIVSGFIVSGAWTLYSVASDNSEMALQNFVLFAINAIVVSLFVIYPNKTANKPKKSKKKNN